MKKVPMILLLIAPYAIVFLCDQTGLDFSIGLWIYGALLAFNMVYAFLLPRLGFRVKQILFWNLLLKLCHIPLILLILVFTLVMMLAGGEGIHDEAASMVLIALLCASNAPESAAATTPMISKTKKTVSMILSQKK